MLLQPIPLSPYHSSQSLFFLLARTLNNALWKITHNCKSYTYPSARNRFYFSFIQRYSMDQPCWHWKHMFLYPKVKCRGPETGLMPDQKKIIRYIMSRTIYLQLLYFLRTEIYHMQSNILHWIQSRRIWFEYYWKGFTIWKHVYSNWINFWRHCVSR